MAPLVTLAVGISLLLFLESVSGQLSSYWSKDDVRGVFDRAAHIPQVSNSIEEIYFAMQLLSHTDRPEAHCDCDKFMSVAKKDQTNAVNIAYALRTADLCKCPFSPSSAAVDVVKSSLQVNLCCTLLLVAVLFAHLSALRS